MSSHLRSVLQELLRKEKEACQKKYRNQTKRDEALTSPYKATRKTITKRDVVLAPSYKRNP